MMGKPGDIIEAEHRAGALDRVHGPEYPAHDLEIGRIFFKLKKRGFQLLKQLPSFLAKNLCVFLISHDPPSRSTVSRKRQVC